MGRDVEKVSVEAVSLEECVRSGMGWDEESGICTEGVGNVAYGWCMRCEAGAM